MGIVVIVVKKEIENLFTNKKRDDLLLLYFSGHGLRDDAGDVFLADKDTDLEFLRATSLDAGFIMKEMNQTNSRRSILILDCCNSGAFTKGHI